MKALSIALVGVSLLAAVVVSKPIDSTAEVEPEIHAGAVDIPPPNVPLHGCVPAMGSCAEDKNCCSNKCIGWPVYACGGGRTDSETNEVDDVDTRSVEMSDEVQTEDSQEEELVSKPVEDTAPARGNVAVTDAGANKCIPDLGSCGKDENCCSKMCRWNMMMGYICIPNKGEWGNAAETDAIHGADSKTTDTLISVREEVDSTACALDLKWCDEDKDCCSKFCRWGWLNDVFNQTCQHSEVDPEDSSKSCIPPGGSCGFSKDCCDKKCIGWPVYRCGG